MNLLQAFYLSINIWEYIFILIVDVVAIAVVVMIKNNRLF